jgi:histidine triad (HIT) family protein
MVHDCDKDCAFCKIVHGDAPARVVYETNDCLAFLPLTPATRGHTLLVSKQHVRDIWSLDIELGTKMLSATLLISHALKASLKPDGLNVINSAGEAASQTVYHVHIHLVPRWYNDHIGDIWPPKEPWHEETLDDLAEVVRAACTGLSL